MIHFRKLSICRFMGINMTKYPNREALRKAHDIYRDAMREFICQYLANRVQDETVEDLIMRALNREEHELIDIKGISAIFKNRECWDDFFSHKFGYDQRLGRNGYDIRSVTSLIVMGRNKVSHPGSRDLDPDYTDTHLFLITEVLGEIGKTQAKYEVQDIWDDLCSDEPEEHPAKIEIANLKERLANTDDELKAEKEQHQDTQNKLAEMEGMEEEWLEMEESRKAASKELTDTRAENTELKERLSETENRLKTVESESAECIKTLTERLRTVEARKTGSEERPKNLPIEEWRRKIWKQLCDYAAQKDTPVRFHKPGSAHYLNVSRSLIDLTGFKMNVWLGRNNREIAIRLYMSKHNFYILKKQRKEIEQEFCESLVWEKLPQRSDSRISLRKDIIDPTDESAWQNQHEWVISKLEKFHKKFNEVFLPRIQELNTSNSLSEDEEHLPPNPVTPNSVTFQGTTFTKRLNKYRVEGDEITQTFWHYWHSQGHEGKQEMRDAGWSVEKVNGDWEVTISPEGFQTWIEENDELLVQPMPLPDERIVLPTGPEMEQPVLEFLADRKEYPRVEIIDLITKHFSLTDDERRYLSKTGKAEKYLVKEGLIERTRTGHYRITVDVLEALGRDTMDEDIVFSNEVYTESQSDSESPAKSPKSQRKWRRSGAVAALRDPAEIQETEAKIAKILNPSEKARLERELREAKRAVDGS